MPVTPSNVDELFVKLQNTVYSASEDDGHIQICAVKNSSLTFAFNFDVILSLNSTDESSLEGLCCISTKERLSCSFSADFPVSSEVLHFDLLSPTACVDMVINNDDIAEKNKYICQEPLVWMDRLQSLTHLLEACSFRIMMVFS